MITETEPAANPQGVDDPNPDPQSQAGDSGQTGSEGNNPPEPPKYVHQLAGDLKEHPLVLKNKDLSDLVREYVGFAERADRLVELPGDDADDETRAQFLDRLRPASPDDYQLEAPELPEGMTYSKELEADFRKRAHELGLSQEQAKALHEYDIERTKAAINARRQAQEAAIHELKKEWGDQFDGRVNEVRQAFNTIAKELGDDTLAERMVSSGYGNDPSMLKMFYGIWQKIKPDTLIEGDPNPPKGESDSDWYPKTNFDD